ncbi:SWIM zinc finger family protein [Kineococcus gypseus]|uniref:SWIM zinc finger family protein n=1 Tax=Kineococcus gypseus TaxID=1637102 RepID=UPI003D7E406A
MTPPPAPRTPRTPRTPRSAGRAAARPARARWSRRLAASLAAPPTASPAAPVAGAIGEAAWRRGRTAAEDGAVRELRVRPGAVGGRVQGERPRPWLVEVGVRRFGPAELDALVAVLVDNPLLIAPLAGGDVPPVLVDLLAEVGVELLPSAGEVAWDCSCPDDGAGACEHAAALVHALGEHLDAEPGELLVLRGAAPAGLLRRVEAAASGPSPAADDLAAELAADPARFHAVPAEPPEPAVLARPAGRTAADDLDAAVLGPGGEGVPDALRPLYAALRAHPGGR